jgi:O-antigen ligase
MLHWARPDGVTFAARYVHNEYVQVLVELGVIGLALLVLLGLGFFGLLRRGGRIRDRRGVAAGAVAC